MNATEYLLKVYPENKTEFIISNSTLLDGGRSSFYCESSDINLWIRIVDKAVESETYYKGLCPGGLYVNDTLVEINSELEKIVLSVLENAKLDKVYNIQLSKEDQKIFGVSSYAEGERKRINEIINFVKSEEYLRLGKITRRI